MSASSSGQRDMQASRFPPGQLLFGSLVVAGVGSVPAVVPAVGASVGGSVGGTVVASGQIILLYIKVITISKFKSLYP